MEVVPKEYGLRRESLCALVNPNNYRYGRKLKGWSCKRIGIDKEEQEQAEVRHQCGPQGDVQPVRHHRRQDQRQVNAAHPAALIVRTAWVYAAQGNNFVHTMLRLMRERPEVRVVADQVGTPTHADSLARAIWALDAAHTTGIHHWTDAGVASWYDFAVAIHDEALALGLLEQPVAVVPIRTVDYPTPARRPAMSVLDKSSSWAITGPAAHWRTELRLALQALKALSAAKEGK